MAAFNCVVCFEERAERLPLPKLSTLNGDTMRASDCNHPVCQACMAAFVVARVEEQRVFGIRCPFESCKVELHEQDIANLVSRGALSVDIQKRFAQLRKNDYTARVESFSDDTQVRTVEDYKLMKMLWASTRRCPRCNVLMQKSQGCNSFGCICGHRFNYSQAPRGCGDGIEDFDSVITLAADFQMDLQEAQRRVVDGQKKGITKYQRVLSMADQKQIPLSLAEVHMQAFLRQPSALEELREARCTRRLDKKAESLSSRLAISMDEAKHLLEQAKLGDAAAWARIRQARSGNGNATA